MLTENEIAYLQGLVRGERKEREKRLERFQARPGQPAGEVEEAREKLERKLEFLATVEERLAAMRAAA